MVDFIVPGIEQILIFLFVLIAAIFLGNILNLLIRRFLDGRIGKSASKSLARTIQYTIIILALWYGLTQILNLNIAAFAASLGILSLAVAFSAQQLIQNAIAAILISARGVVRLEDWVEVGASGVAQIKDITFTHTMLRTITGKRIYLANSSLLTTPLTNYTQAGISAVDIRIAFQWDGKFDTLLQLCKDVAHDHLKILPNVSKQQKKEVSKILKLPDFKAILGPKEVKRTFEPQILFDDVNFGRVNIIVRVWITDISQRDIIVSEYYEELFLRLKKNKIEIS